MSAQPTDAVRRLHALFNAGHSLTLEQLQDELGLSERQVRRILTRMREKHGIPVEEERHGRLKRFFLPPEHRHVETRPGIDFAERELFALTVAAKAARSALSPTPLGPALQTAFDKLLDGMQGEVLSFEPEFEASHWHFESTAVSNIDPQIFEALTRAITESRTVRIDYYSASQRQHFFGRLIDPYLIATRGSSWLLVAYCREQCRFVDFSLPAVTKVEPEAAFFERKAFDAEAHFRDRFSALQGDDVYTIRLHVAPDKAPYFERKTYHPTQMIEERRADGAYLVSFEVSGLDEISAFIRSWGPGVTVLEPEELRSRIAGEALRVAEAHGAFAASNPA